MDAYTFQTNEGVLKVIQIESGGIRLVITSSEGVSVGKSLSNESKNKLISLLREDAAKDKEAQPGVSDAVEEGLTAEQIKAIEDMADRTFELCKMEENLLRDAYPLIDSFRLRAPAKDTSFTKRAVEQWLKDYQLFKSNNKQGRNG